MGLGAAGLPPASETATDSSQAGLSGGHAVYHIRT